MTRDEAIRRIEYLKCKAEVALANSDTSSEWLKTDVMGTITSFSMAVEALEQTRWIPVTERLPENEQEVEITYTSKHWKTGEPLYFTCRAFYTDGTMNTEDSSYVWNEIDNWEYNENLDAYIIPEGWWEVVSFAEEFSCVDQPVIAWMPLPEPYKAGEQDG